MTALVRLFLRRGSVVVTVIAALQMVVGLIGLSLLLRTAHQTNRQQDAADNRQNQTDDPQHVQQALYRAYIGRQSVVRGNILMHGLRRRDNRRLGGYRRGIRIADVQNIAVEGNVLLQNVLARGDKLILTRHGHVDITGEGAAFARQNGGEVV